MVNQIESGRLPGKTPREWDADLDGSLDRTDQLGDVPLRLTEARIRAETDRIGNVEPIERTPKGTSAAARAEPPMSPRTSEPAAGSRPESPARRGAGAGDVALKTANQPSRSGSILALDTAQLCEPQSPAVTVRTSPVDRRSAVRTPVKEQKRARRSHVLWGVVVALVIALAAESGYAYLAIRRNSVNIAQLPGAAVLRTLGAQMEGARAKFQQSGVSAESNAAGHQAGAALDAAYQGARRLALEVRDRYNQRHSR